jgi:RNA polymerase sigma factor (sigma-70 family)
MVPLTRLLFALRRLDASRGDSDAHLLGRFAAGGDEAAFTALLARHGPMVLSACRRVLGDADAEDAFQATFLVLARKAGSVRRPDALAGWLHGVACRVALKARAIRRARSAREAGGTGDQPDRRPDPLEELSARDLLVVLEEEVSRLPEHYRMPIVLCCLEGVSQEEAARRLCWTAGAVKGRLERGRRRLQQRLARRGLAPAAATAALAVAGRSAAEVPAGLLGSTTRAALAFAASDSTAGVEVSEQVMTLANGGLQAMSQSKLKAVVVIVVALGTAGAGMGWLAAGSEEKLQDKASPPAKKADGPPVPGGDKRRDAKRPDAVEKARKELAVADAEVLDAEEAWSRKIVEAREELVVLEERVRDAEADVRAARTVRAEESRKESFLKGQVAATRDEIAATKDKERMSKLQSDLKRHQSLLDEVVNRRLELRENAITRLIELRREQVRQEEALRQLERRRTAAREEAERRRDDAAARLRELQGSAPRQPDRDQRALERKLDAMLRELKREIERQRKGREE